MYTVDPHINTLGRPKLSHTCSLPQTQALMHTPGYTIYPPGLASVNTLDCARLDREVMTVCTDKGSHPPRTRVRGLQCVGRPGRQLTVGGQKCDITAVEPVSEPLTVVSRVRVFNLNPLNPGYCGKTSLGVAGAAE